MVERQDRFGEVIGNALREDAWRCRLPPDFTRRLLRACRAPRQSFPRWARVAASFAAVLSFSFLSFAAVVTVPALAPVRETVAAWFAEEDNGGTGVPPVQVADVRGTGVPPVQEESNGGTGVPPVQEDNRGTGVPPVQSETVFEPKQEDTTLTQPNTTVTRENTMNTKKMAAIAGATMLGLTASVGAQTDPECIRTLVPNQSWCVLNYIPVSNTVIEVTLQVPKGFLGKVNNVLFCARGTSAADHTYTGWLRNTNKFRWDYGNELGTEAAGLVAEEDTEYVVTFDPSSGLSVNGTLLQERSMIEDFVSANKLMLLASYTGKSTVEPMVDASSGFTSLRIYRYRIWEGAQTDENLKFDLKPGWASDGSLALKDALTGTAYTSKGRKEESPFGNAVWQKNTPDPIWWFTESAWDIYPPNGTVTLLAKANNSRSNIYLQDGDEVAVSGVVLCHQSYTGGDLRFQVPKGASFTFMGSLYSNAQNFTNVIDIAGGTVRGNSLTLGNKVSSSSVFVTNGADVAVGSMTIGAAAPVDLYVENSTLSVTNNSLLLGPTAATSTYGSRLVGKNATLTVRPSSMFYTGVYLYRNSQILLEDSTLDIKNATAFYVQNPDAVVRLTNTVVTTPGIKLSSNVEFELVGDETSVNVSSEMSLGSNAKFIQRGGTMTVSKNNNTINMFTTSSGETTGPTMEIYGGTFVMTNRHASGGVFLDLSGAGKPTFRQYGGTFMSYGAYFGATSTNVPRCEIYGGKFCACGYVNNQNSLGGVFNKSDATKGGVFSIYGGVPEVRMQRIGTHNVTTTQPQLDYVICTNGIPTIYMDTPPYGLWESVNGYFTIRPLGGVQLIHNNVVTLLDGTAAKRRMSCQNLDAGGFLFPNATLWERGATSSQAAIKVTLKEDAELADGAYYAEGKSCGYLKIPQIKSEWRIASVYLNLVPQGNETLDTLVAGFTAAGYNARCISGDYNVKLRIPRELLVDGSADEKMLIDFNEYADAEAVRDAQPTVRALVRRASFVHDPGLVLFLR